MSSTAEKGRVLLVLYRNCTRRSSDARDKIAIDRLVFFFFPLDLEPASICQGGEPGKELDLAKWWGECGRGIGGPGTELKKERWSNQITHCRDHLTQWSPYPALCRRLSSSLASDGSFGPLAHPSAKCVTVRQKYLEDVEGRVTNRNDIYTLKCLECSETVGLNSLILSFKLLLHVHNSIAKKVRW